MIKIRQGYVIYDSIGFFKRKWLARDIPGRYGLCLIAALGQPVEKDECKPSTGSSLAQNCSIAQNSERSHS